MILWPRWTPSSSPFERVCEERPKRYPPSPTFFFFFFFLAVLLVLSDPEPLEQCSNGSAPWADPSERTEPELISDLLSNRRLDDFVRQKQGFLRQVLLCLVVCFHFGLAQFSQLLSSFATVVSPTKRKAATMRWLVQGSHHMEFKPKSHHCCSSIARLLRHVCLPES